MATSGNVILELVLKFLLLFLRSVLTDRALHWWILPLAISGSLVASMFEAFDEKEYDILPFLVIFAVIPILARTVGVMGNNQENNLPESEASEKKDQDNAGMEDVAKEIYENVNRNVTSIDVKDLPKLTHKFLASFFKSVLSDRALHWWILPVAISGSIAYSMIEMFDEEEYDEFRFLIIFAVLPILVRAIGLLGNRTKKDPPLEDTSPDCSNSEITDPEISELENADPENEDPASSDPESIDRK